MNAPDRRAIALVSDGPDGTLAAALARRAGLDTRLVHVRTGFARRDRGDGPFRLPAVESALGLGVEVVDLRDRYVDEVLREPRHGYGAAMNPCMDCRIRLLAVARGLADRDGIPTVVTGEVLGQRPWCQSRAGLEAVARESGLGDRLLRPLSAGLLPPTRAERTGAVARSSLGRAHGRGSRGARSLAASLGIAGLQPGGAGCCVLADRSFAPRVRDLLAHVDRGRTGPEEIALLRAGRYLRLRHDLRVAVARDEREGALLDRLGGDRWRLEAEGGGATVLVVEGTLDEAAARIAARYSRHRDLPRVDVRAWRPGEEVRLGCAPALDPRPL